MNVHVILVGIITNVDRRHALKEYLVPVVKIVSKCQKMEYAITLNLMLMTMVTIRIINFGRVKT